MRSSCAGYSRPKSRAGAEDAELRVTLLFEPVEAAGILDGLPISLEGQADIGAADLVGALVAVGHTAVGRACSF